MPIRPATIGDGAAISRLLTQLEYPGTEVFMEAKLREMLKAPSEVLLVWDDPPVHGFISLQFIPMIGVGDSYPHRTRTRVSPASSALRFETTPGPCLLPPAGLYRVPQVSD